MNKKREPNFTKRQTSNLLASKRWLEEPIKFLGTKNKTVILELNLSELNEVVEALGFVVGTMNVFDLNKKRKHFVWTLRNRLAKYLIKMETILIHELKEKQKNE